MTTPLPADPDKPCLHEDFEARVEVNRLLEREDDIAPNAFSADITVNCARCGERFRWIGLQAGLSGSKPMCSVDEFTLSAPLRPASSDPDFGLGIPTRPVRPVLRPAVHLLRGQSGSLTLAKQTPCQTHDTIFGTVISKRRILIEVHLPFDLALAKEDAEILDANIHNVLELVLARYFKPRDSAAAGNVDCYFPPTSLPDSRCSPS